MRADRVLHPDAAPDNRRSILNTIKPRLAGRIGDLALDLIGTAPTSKTATEWRFGSKGALAVRVAGPKCGTFADFSADAKGDAIDLIRHMRACSTADALRWAAAWLGEAVEPPARSAAPPTRPEAPEGTTPLARRLWAEAQPAAGTLADAYLRHRGLALETDAPLRFHPAAWRAAGDGPRGPAMIALMTDPASAEPRGVHITYLARDGRGKAPGKRSKIMLGRVGTIRLVPDDAVTLGLGLAEGVETSLAVMQRAGWRPVWAATSAGAIASFPVLPGVETITLFADADTAGERAATQCAVRWAEAGIPSRILRPPAGDFDDASMTGRAA